jgi:hypothetical protein
MSGPLFEALRSRQGACADLFAWASYNTFSVREQQHSATARMRNGAARYLPQCRRSEIESEEHGMSGPDSMRCRV